MPKSFELRSGEGGRVIVILHPACAISREAILALLAQLDIEPSSVVFVLSEEAEALGDLQGVPVIFPIDQPICDTPELDLAGRQCAQAGARVIVLLGEDLAYEGLHPIAEKYGTQCGWAADQLDTCLSSHSAPAPPKSSSGVLVARSKSQQVKC